MYRRGVVQLERRACFADFLTVVCLALKRPECVFSCSFFILL